MASSEYDWNPGSPALLEPHSLAKHTILRRYVEEYVRILTINHRVPEFRLALVDGFAGGGEYIVKGQEGIHDGSPFILIKAVQAAEALVNQGRTKPITINARFVFVEKKESNFSYLRDALDRRLDKKTRGSVTAIHGAFEDYIDWLIEDMKSARGRKPRPIFVLDQYGYSDVPVEMIAKIMRDLPNAEVFLTLAYGWIGAYAKGPKAQALRIEKSLHIAPHLRGFAEGKRDVDEIAELPANDRVEAMRYIQQLLHEGFAKQGGARCYTPFFITSRESNRSYWFLHLANSPRANDVVKELHWGVKNHFMHFGSAGTMMLGYDPARPPDDGEQQAFGFDKSARTRTVEALISELPGRIQREYPEGVSVDELYASICNETPASKELLREPIRFLCRELALEKRGAEGEERALTTKVKDKDVIRVPAQRAFSFDTTSSQGSGGSGKGDR